MSNIRGPSNSSGRPPGGGGGGRQNYGHHNNGAHSSRRGQQQWRKKSNSRSFPVQDSSRSAEENNSRQRRHTEPMEVDPTPMDLPGLYYDPVTQKHYAFAPENSGISGYTQREISTAQRHQQLLRQVSASYEQRVKRPVVRNLAMLSARCEAGLLSVQQMQRNFFESRLLSVKSRPNTIADLGNPIDDGSVTGCSFISASKDGRSLFGCWTVQKAHGVRTSFNACASVKIDEKLRQRYLRELDNREREDDGFPLNTMGLEFELSPQYTEVCAPEVVDMRVAQVDSEVYICLYATAATKISQQNQLRSECNLWMYPLTEWSSCENPEILCSPIYNIFWPIRDHIWSCGWNARKMQVSVGYEKCASIVDIVSDKSFKISSQSRNVLSQEFSPEGNLIYMGLQGKDVICSDLRMPSRHIVSHFKHTTNSCFVHAMKSTYEHHVVTQGFNGALSLWDTRQTRKSLLDFEGHTNDAFRLPCVVDADERFLFAVGSDGCTRGWSLYSGELLCELPSEHPPTDRAGFPRVAYSDCWGGRVGNSALLIAYGSSVRLHQLDL